MNTIPVPPAGRTPRAERPRRRAAPGFRPLLLVSLSLCLLSSGCLSFKPARSSTRYFVLPAMAAPASTNAVGPLALGLGQVKLPPYLLKSEMAVRRGPNELEYLEDDQWAERLDLGCQQVLAADLAQLLPARQVRLSAWNREDVQLELYVSLEQFEGDAVGHATLVATWRILSPGGEKLLKSGETHLTRSGPAPAADPGGAAGTLGGLLEDLARALSQEIHAAQAQ